MQAPPMVEEVPEVGGDGLPKVPIDELDFDFVEKCTDHKKLRDILAILESGKEGHYPELIQTTIDRLLATLPAKEKKLFISLRSKPSATEEDEAKSSLSDWIGEISKIDAAVSKKVRQPGAEAQDSKEIFADQDDNDNAAAAKAYASRVPVRNQGGGAAKAGPVKQQLGSSTASINTPDAEPRWTKAKPDPKARDFKSYYDDWDKFDPDEELGKLDAEDQAAEAERRRRQQASEARLKAEAEARKERMTELGISLDPTEMSEEERAFTSDREKRKGNECFKANEFEDAVLYYSRSIFVKPDNCVVWANRAMAYLRLKQYEQAEADCTEAIRLDPTYIKAISRRAMTFVPTCRFCHASLHIVSHRLSHRARFRTACLLVDDTSEESTNSLPKITTRL